MRANDPIARLILLAALGGGCLLDATAQGGRRLVIVPPVSDVAGGGFFYVDSPLLLLDEEGIVYFDDAPMVALPPNCNSEEPVFCSLQGLVPARATPGLADVTILSWRPGSTEPDVYFYPSAFEYVDVPRIDRIEPDNHSIGPDNRQLALHGTGFPVLRPAEVWVGGQPASNVATSTTSYGARTSDELRCIPPPFPGGDWPLTVDVRVVTVGGGETILPGAYTYRQIVPVFKIFPTEIAAWSDVRTLTITIENFVESPDVQVYFDQDLVFSGCPRATPPCTSRGYNIGAAIPSRAPGLVDITLVNPDGGTYTQPDAFLFYRTSPRHLADTDGDSFISLSELLRVVQFYAADGYHCDNATEDGFAPGAAGDQGCVPHDSDLITQDWRVDLHEILELIQIYNSNGYHLCANRWQFCLGRD